MGYYSYLKRFLDILLSSFVLFIFSPFFYLIIVMIKIDSPGKAFFKQTRIGHAMQPFNLIKFRTMVFSEEAKKSEFEPGDGSRVTKIGSILRRTKIDELPEVFNVLTGDMAIVGPRPEVERYVKMYPESFQKILEIRPGLSDFASIKYRNEENILAKQSDPEYFYSKVILPEKLRLSEKYVSNVSWKIDLQIMKNTIKSILTKLNQEDIR